MRQLCEVSLQRQGAHNELFLRTCKKEPGMNHASLTQGSGTNMTFWQSRAQVVNFLCWAAEPAHDERKLIGLKAEVGCGGPLHRMRRHAGVTGFFHYVLHAGPCGGHVRLLCRDIHCWILVPQYVDRADALRDVKQ